MRRRRRASPHSRYSGSENTSSAMNIVSRSPHAGNSIIPPTASKARGKTSVVTAPARVASNSASVLGTEAPEGVNMSASTPPPPGPPRVIASSPPPTPASLRIVTGATTRSSRRSAMNPTAMTAMISSRPCRYSAGRSITTAPDIANSPFAPSCVCATATAIRAPNPTTNPPSASESCRAYRSLRGAKASTRTPTTPTPKTMSIGARDAYSTLGVSMAASVIGPSTRVVDVISCPPDQTRRRPVRAPRRRQW